MKYNVYLSEIKWLTKEQGGRKSGIPRHYGPQIKFDGLKGDWSVIVNSYQILSENESISKMFYLNALEAPNNLKEGLKFELYEGNKLTAKGMIIEKLVEIYTFEDFKNDIIESGLESKFKYKDKVYDLSIVPGRYKFFNKKKEKPMWRLFNESENIEMIRSKIEDICDEILIDGKILAEIWEEIIIV